MKLSNLSESIQRPAIGAYNLAKKIGRRVPSLESILAKDAIYAYRYAVYVLHGRFPLGEPEILDTGKNYPGAIINYAVECVRGRWPEGEKILKRDASAWSDYKTRLFNDLGIRLDESE